MRTAEIPTSRNPDNPKSRPGPNPYKLKFRHGRNTDEPKSRHGRNPDTANFLQSHASCRDFSSGGILVCRNFVHVRILACRHFGRVGILACFHFGLSGISAYRKRFWDCRDFGCRDYDLVLVSSNPSALVKAEGFLIVPHSRRLLVSITGQITPKKGRNTAF